MSSRYCPKARVSWPPVSASTRWSSRRARPRSAATTSARRSSPECWPRARSGSSWSRCSTPPSRAFASAAVPASGVCGRVPARLT